MRAQIVERAEVRRWQDADHRRLDGVGAKRLQKANQFRRLLSRAGDEDPLAEQRPGVEPAQMLTERSHTSRNQDGGPAVPIRWSGQGADVPKRSSSRDLRRQRAIQE